MVGQIIGPQIVDGRQRQPAARVRNRNRVRAGQDRLAPLLDLLPLALDDALVLLQKTADFEVLRLPPRAGYGLRR